MCAQSSLTFCNPMDCSPPGSYAHGIFQARILEWVASSSCRGSSWPRDQTHVSHFSCIAGRWNICKRGPSRDLNLPIVSFSVYALGLFHLTREQAQASWKLRGHRTCLQSFQLFKTWPAQTNQSQPTHLLAADAWMSPDKINWAPSSPEEQLSYLHPAHSTNHNIRLKKWLLCKAMKFWTNLLHSKS